MIYLVKSIIFKKQRNPFFIVNYFNPKLLPKLVAEASEHGIRAVPIEPNQISECIKNTIYYKTCLFQKWKDVYLVQKE